MAGVSTPALAAATSNAGGLGSLGIGISTPSIARDLIRSTQNLTKNPFQVNLFVHSPPKINNTSSSNWLEYLRPAFQEFEVDPPKNLSINFKSFIEDEEMLEVLLETKPKIISFHFGLPPSSVISKLKGIGTILMASATSLKEVQLIEEAGLDAVILQGYEAGGHRGIFDQNGKDEKMDMISLLERVVQKTQLPVIAAGGIMDGSTIFNVLLMGATAVQMGTAFLLCPESSADSHYRSAIKQQHDKSNGAQTTMTTFISGRPARSLVNRFTSIENQLGKAKGVPDYPIAYDAGKALYAAAKNKGEGGFGAQWAGEGVGKAREMPAAELIQVLEREMEEARAKH